jgi:hypothetical protein
MAHSSRTPRLQRFPPDITEQSYPTLGSSSQPFGSASIARRTVNALMGAPPYVFPRAAIAATPVCDDSSPFIVSTPSNPVLRRVESTSPQSVGVPQWPSSTLNEGEDNDDEYHYEADDGSLAGSDLEAELELRVDGREVSSRCISSKQHRLFCSRQRTISHEKRCQLGVCESARSRSPLELKPSSP